jgi:C-terminal processing protease CtpA/Prc
MQLTPNRCTLLLLAIFLISLTPLTDAADEKNKGWFGFAVSAEIEGVSFNPVLQTVRIAKVVPSSPAAAAGLAEGDLIVEVEGLVIPGGKARELKKVMFKAIGESMHLKIKHGTSEPRAVTLVAIAKPEGK